VTSEAEIQRLILGFEAVLSGKDAGRVVDASDAVIDDVERVRALVGQGDGPEAVRRLALASWIEAYVEIQRERLRQAFDAAIRTERLLAGTDLLEIRGRNWSILGQLFARSGHVEESIRWFRRVEGLAGAVTPYCLNQARLSLAWVLRRDGRLEEATRILSEMLTLPDDDPLLPSVLINAASTLWQVGRAEEAEELILRARALPTLAARSDLSAWSDAIGAWVAAARRDWPTAADRARRALAGAAGRSDIRGSASRALGTVALEGGDPAIADEARAAIEEALRQTAARSLLVERLELLGVMSRLCEARGDFASAVRHLAAARALEAGFAREGRKFQFEAEDLRVELARVQLEAATLRAHQEALDEANRALSRSDAARLRLLRTLAHDLRNPLTSLFASLELARMPDPARASRGLTLAMASAQRMEEILGAVLGSSGAREPLATTDVAAVARGSAAAFESLTIRKGQLLLVSAPGPALVEGDASAVGRIIDNLLSNAIKFTPMGGAIHVRVDATPTRVELHVLDDGPGFPPESLDEGPLFGHQLATRPTGGESGLGIGLHTVHELVTGMGGTLRIGNRREGGADVRVMLPTPTHLRAAPGA